MKCPKCKTKLDKGVDVCPKCGGEVVSPSGSGKKIVLAVVAVLLVAAVVIGILFWKGFLGETASPTDDAGTTAPTEEIIYHGSTDAKMVRFRYYYLMQWLSLVSNMQQYSSSYGTTYGYDITQPPDDQIMSTEAGGDGTSTWGEYLIDNTITYVVGLDALYRAAVDEGLELDEEELAQVEETVTSLEQTAQTANMTSEEYLSEYYGVGITVDYIRQISSEQALAQKYADLQQTTVGDSCTDEYLQSTYEANKNEYDVVSMRCFNFEIADFSNAEESANSMLAAVSDDESFIAEAKKYQAMAPVEEATTAADGTTSQPEEYDADKETSYFKVFSSEIVSYSCQEVADWAFDAQRKVGDKAVIATDTAYFVVLFTQERLTPSTVDVRHIMFFTTDATTGAPISAEEYAAVKEKAESVYQEWLDGEQTEEAFAALSEKYSEDTANAEDGGLYSKLGRGDMTQEFNDWAFGTGRKPGDCELIEASYAFHIMYYVKTNEDDFPWETTVKETYVKEKYDAIIDGLIEANKSYLSADDEAVKNELGYATTLVKAMIDALMSDSEPAQTTVPELITQ